MPEYTDDNEDRLEHGSLCLNCEREVTDIDVVDLPIVAFKQEMFDVCFFEASSLNRAWRGQTVIAYHEDVDVQDGSASLDY